ncbi:MAG: hypothetical protein ACHQ9S_25655 [Candidatus Binatia bacterium]
MTVCLAAISRGLVIMACDRMITSGDVEYEGRPGLKCWWFTSSVAALWAGDAAFQTEVLEDVTARVQKRVAERPTDWWRVQDVAELYCARHAAARYRRAETDTLGRMGVDPERFRNGTHGLSNEIVDNLMERMINFELPGEEYGGGTETIITGIDTSHGSPIAHLYRTWKDKHFCEDSIGFAAIGYGASHAKSQFQLGRYDGTKPGEEALWRSYVAKKRSEVAPGVGSNTDMFTIGAQLGANLTIKQEWIAELEARYRQGEAAEQLASEANVNWVKDWLEKKGESKATPQDKGGSSGPPGPTGPTPPGAPLVPPAGSGGPIGPTLVPRTA